MLFWAGSSSTPEGYAAAASLGATSYPFLALLLPSGSEIRVLERFDGYCPEQELCTKLERALQQHRALAVEAARQRSQIDERTRLRQEQDLAIQQAMEDDRRREEERLAAAARAEEEEQQRELEGALQMSVALARSAELRRKREALPAEPARGPGVTQLRLLLPSGTRVQRRFQCNTTVQQLCDFVEVILAENSGQEELCPFELACSFPKRCFRPFSSSDGPAAAAAAQAAAGADSKDSEEASAMEQTLETAGLHPQAMLHVTLL